MSKIDIKGLDLEIDSSVQKVCETSNSTSSNTRKVMYLLVLISGLSLISFINTHFANWPSKRAEIEKKEILAIAKNMTRDKLSKLDSIRISTQFLIKKSQLDARNRSNTENFQTVRIPILGSAFDIDSLSIISGLSILLLMIILKFTLSRELNNLRIALNSITERYSDKSDLQIFREKFSDIRNLNPNISITDEDIITQINLTRRIYHYNYLSMNEIFNLPPLKYSESVKNNINNKILMKIYYTPTIVYFIILLNDFSTVYLALRLDFLYTIFTLFISITIFIKLTRLSWQLTKSKETLNYLFKDFSERGYVFE